MAGGGTECGGLSATYEVTAGEVTAAHDGVDIPIDCGTDATCSNVQTPDTYSGYDWDGGFVPVVDQVCTWVSNQSGADPSGYGSWNGRKVDHTATSLSLRTETGAHEPACCWELSVAFDISSSLVYWVGHKDFDGGDPSGTYTRACASMEPETMTVSIP